MLPDNYIEARRLLLRQWPFYGMPSMKAGDPIFVDAVSTACTDGIHIFVNPKFINKMPVPYLAAVIGHECIHIVRTDADTAARAEWPDGTKILNLHKLNQAQDHWINLNMVAEGFQFPPIGICCDAHFIGMSVRQIYDALPDPPPDDNEEGQGGCGTGPAGQGAGDDEKFVSGKDICGGNDIAPKKLSAEEIAENRIAVRQAYEAARSAGKLPGWAEQYVKKLREPRTQFRDFFEAWLHDAFDKDDITYRRLNHHYLFSDLFAPTMTGMSFGDLVVGLDTSGSCWNQSARFLALFNNALKQLRPCTTTLLQFDDAIQSEHKFGPGETVEAGLKIKGNGGTSFVHVFNWIRKHKQDSVDGLIMLTDLWGAFPPSQPSYPVLWVSISTDRAPFGSTWNLSSNPQED